MFLLLDPVYCVLWPNRCLPCEPPLDLMERLVHPTESFDLNLGETLRGQVVNAHIL